MPYRPITIDQGKLQQLPAGQALDVGGWTLPTSGGTENYVLTADASGNAVWAETASDFGDPSVDDQVLISTGAGSANGATFEAGATKSPAVNPGTNGSYIIGGP